MPTLAIGKMNSFPPLDFEYEFGYNVVFKSIEVIKMNKPKGFTLIELIVAIITVISLGIVVAQFAGSHGLPIGSRTVCKAGVTFNVDVNGTEQQIIGVDGRPVGCNG